MHEPPYLDLQICRYKNIIACGRDMQISLLVKENKVRLTVDESPKYRAHSCSSHGNLKEFGQQTCLWHIILLLM